MACVPPPTWDATPSAPGTGDFPLTECLQDSDISLEPRGDTYLHRHPSSTSETFHRGKSERLMKRESRGLASTGSLQVHGHCCSRALPSTLLFLLLVPACFQAIVHLFTGKTQQAAPLASHEPTPHSSKSQQEQLRSSSISLELCHAHERALPPDHAVAPRSTLARA